MTEIRTKGSLCTGTGALDLAVPGELAWYAERDDQAAYAQARATADQISKAVAELLSIARNDRDAERARQAQEALAAIGESASAQLLWVTKGIA